MDKAFNLSRKSTLTSAMSKNPWLTGWINAVHWVWCWVMRWKGGARCDLVGKDCILLHDLSSVFKNYWRMAFSLLSLLQSLPQMYPNTFPHLCLCHVSMCVPLSYSSSVRCCPCQLLETAGDRSLAICKLQPPTMLVESSKWNLTLVVGFNPFEIL